MARNKPRIPDLNVEDAKIVLRNFAGKEGRLNAEGQRNFLLLLPDDVANRLIDQGWHVKYLKPREEGEPEQAFIKVKVKFGKYPPTVVMISGRGQVHLDEDTVKLLDVAQFKNVDLVVNPSRWTMDDGSEGVTAYLKAGYFTIEEDQFAKKYYDVPDSAIRSMVGDYEDDDRR